MGITGIFAEPSKTTRNRHVAGLEMAFPGQIHTIEVTTLADLIQRIAKDVKKEISFVFISENLGQQEVLEAITNIVSTRKDIIRILLMTSEKRTIAPLIKTLVSQSLPFDKIIEDAIPQLQAHEIAEKIREVLGHLVPQEEPPGDEDFELRIEGLEDPDATPFRPKDGKE